MKIDTLQEPYVGAWMQHSDTYRSLSTTQKSDRQRLLQQLYETRFASLERLVGFFVLFHAMAKRVQDFWPRVSFGVFGYDMSRSQSMLRVATTASPISGSEVRERILELAEEERQQWAARCIQRAVRFVQQIKTFLKTSEAINDSLKQVNKPISSAGSIPVIGSGPAGMETMVRQAGETMRGMFTNRVLVSTTPPAGATTLGAADLHA